MIDEKNLLRWIKTECNPYGKPTLDYETSIRIMEFIENNMEKSDEWIPVEEMYPQSGELLIVTRKDCNGSYTTVDEYDEDYFDWISGAGDDVIAWMHLPEPYRPEEPE